MIVPTGVGKQVRQFLSEKDKISVHLADNGILDYKGTIPLYDYQKDAVEAMQRTSCGILQSPCGSGKTQMGIALAAELSRKVLWITHTQDLLTQSKTRQNSIFQRKHWEQSRQEKPGWQPYNICHSPDPVQDGSGPVPVYMGCGDRG